METQSTQPPASGPGGEGCSEEGWRNEVGVTNSWGHCWTFPWASDTFPAASSSHTCQTKCPLKEITFFPNDLLEKDHYFGNKVLFFFFSQQVHRKMLIFILFFPLHFHFFLSFSLSLFFFFLFHFQSLDPPVLPLNENVPLSGKLQGCVWVKPPRDVWPWAWWEQAFIHSEQLFFVWQSLNSPWYLPVLSYVSHSKHSLCFSAHKTAEVHPAQWTNYSALSRYLC